MRQDLKKLLNYSSIKLFSANEYITIEGGISDGINILLKGKVDATFNIQKQNGLEKNTRTIAIIRCSFISISRTT